MGDAMYFAKLYFSSEEDAKKSVKKIENFFKEQALASNYWEDSRTKIFFPIMFKNRLSWLKDERTPKDIKEIGEFVRDQVLNIDSFWSFFRIKYPNTTEYLEFLDLFGIQDLDELNYIFTFRGPPEENITLECDKNKIQVNVDWVWHLANWDDLGRYLTKKFDLKLFEWVKGETKSIPAEFKEIMESQGIKIINSDDLNKLDFIIQDFDKENEKS